MSAAFPDNAKLILNPFPDYLPREVGRRGVFTDAVANNKTTWQPKVTLFSQTDERKVCWTTSAKTVSKHLINSFSVGPYPAFTDNQCRVKSQSLFTNFKKQVLHSKDESLLHNTANGQRRLLKDCECFHVYWKPYLRDWVKPYSTQDWKCCTTNLVCASPLYIAVYSCSFMSHYWQHPPPPPPHQ